MKKVFLLAMLFAATVCNAQVVLWDGTDKEVGSDGGFWNRADPTVVEEDGNKIMKFTLKADVDFKALRRLTMRLKMTDAHNVLVQLEGKDGAYNAERIAWYDGGDGWQVMVYEFAAGPDNEKVTDNGNNVLAIWPFEKTAQGEGRTFYVDDIKSLERVPISAHGMATGIRRLTTTMLCWLRNWLLQQLFSTSQKLAVGTRTGQPFRLSVLAL